MTFIKFKASFRSFVDKAKLKVCKPGEGGVSRAVTQSLPLLDSLQPPIQPTEDAVEILLALNKAYHDPATLDIYKNIKFNLTHLSISVCVGNPTLKQSILSLDPITVTSANSSLITLVAPRQINLEDFEVLKLLGSGASGQVYMVQNKTTKGTHALKVVQKAGKNRGEIECLFEEQETLRALGDSSWLAPLEASWSDSLNFYILMPLYPTDLDSLMIRRDVLDPVTARFYFAEMVIALGELHALGIIHGDIKPANILIDSDGHIALADFGLSTNFRRKPTKEEQNYNPFDPDDPADPKPKSDYFFNDRTSGSALHMAPEIFKVFRYSFGVDDWAAGISLFWALTGRPPWYNDDVEDVTSLKEMVLGDPIEFQDDDNLDDVTKDFLCRILAKDPRDRLRIGPEMRNHPYFADIDWEAMERREVTPPWIPGRQLSHVILDMVERFTPGVPYDDESTNPYSDFDYYSEKLRMAVGVAGLDIGDWGEDSSSPFADPYDHSLSNSTSSLRYHVPAASTSMGQLYCHAIRRSPSSLPFAPQWDPPSLRQRRSPSSISFSPSYQWESAIPSRLPSSASQASAIPSVDQVYSPIIQRSPSSLPFPPQCDPPSLRRRRSPSSLSFSGQWIFVTPYRPPSSPSFASPDSPSCLPWLTSDIPYRSPSSLSFSPQRRSARLLDSMPSYSESPAAESLDTCSTMHSTDNLSPPMPRPLSSTDFSFLSTPVSFPNTGQPSTSYSLLPSTGVDSSPTHEDRPPSFVQRPLSYAQCCSPPTPAHPHPPPPTSFRSINHPQELSSYTHSDSLPSPTPRSPSSIASSFGRQPPSSNRVQSMPLPPLPLTQSVDSDVSPAYEDEQSLSVDVSYCGSVPSSRNSSSASPSSPKLTGDVIAHIPCVYGSRLSPSVPRSSSTPDSSSCTLIYSSPAPPQPSGSISDSLHIFDDKLSLPVQRTPSYLDDSCFSSVPSPKVQPLSFSPSTISSSSSGPLFDLGAYNEKGWVSPFSLRSPLSMDFSSLLTPVHVVESSSPSGSSYASSFQSGDEAGHSAAYESTQCDSSWPFLGPSSTSAFSLSSLSSVRSFYTCLLPQDLSSPGLNPQPHAETPSSRLHMTSVHVVNLISHFSHPQPLPSSTSHIPSFPRTASHLSTNSVGFLSKLKIWARQAWTPKGRRFPAGNRLNMAN